MLPGRGAEKSATRFGFESKSTWRSLVLFTFSVKSWSPDDPFLGGPSDVRSHRSISSCRVFEYTADDVGRTLILKCLKVIHRWGWCLGVKRYCRQRSRSSIYNFDENLKLKIFADRIVLSSIHITYGAICITSSIKALHGRYSMLFTFTRQNQAHII
jgi:hypothetical protein